MELAWTVFTIWILCYVSIGSSHNYDADQRSMLRYHDILEKGRTVPPNQIHNDQSGEYEAEKQAGHLEDMMGSNMHHSYPSEFIDLGRRSMNGRRFVPVYPYIEKYPSADVKDQKGQYEKHNLNIIPVKALPEVVLKAALESVLDQASQPKKETDELARKEMLRTGDYWDGFWVEEADPKLLRSHKQVTFLDTREKKHRATSQKLQKLGTLKANIMPGSKLYQLVSVLKQYSPRLLYVINRN